MKLVHNGREIENNSVDYGDGTVMVQYKDDSSVAIIRKEEIKSEGEE